MWRSSTPTRWTWTRSSSGSASTAAAARPTGGSPAASSSASRWPWPWSAAPSWSSSTSRPRASTRRPGAPPGSWSATCAPTASRSSSPRTYMDEAEQLADDVAIIDARQGHRPGHPRAAVPRRRRAAPCASPAGRGSTSARCSRPLPAGLRGRRADARRATGSAARSTRSCWPTVTSWCAAARRDAGEDLPSRRRTLEDVFLELTGRGAALVTAPPGTLHPEPRRRPRCPG